MNLEKVYSPRQVIRIHGKYLTLQSCGALLNQICEPYFRLVFQKIISESSDYKL